MIIQPMSQSLDGIAELTQLGVLRARGADAANFLHGQLTQDFALLGQHEARLAALCSPKGRMLASFIGFKRGSDEVLLLCGRDLLAATLKRLSMFVLRAKCKLDDASAEFRLAGLAGSAPVALGLASQPAWHRMDQGAATLIVLPPADGVPRVLWVAPSGMPLPGGPAMAEDVWEWGEVRSGVARVGSAITDALVPQMLNYESVGGVSFKKGCYPGQEVVARSQFRGTLKRRAFLAHADVAMSAGQEVYQASDGEQPCGLVAQAARSPAGGCDAVLSLQVSAAEAGALRLGAASGPPLTLGSLPYPLMADL